MWHNNIPDLETLHWRAAESPIVVVSIAKKASKKDPGLSFDLCFLNPISTELRWEPPTDFEEFKKEYYARNHVLRTTRFYPTSKSLIDLDGPMVSYHFPRLLDNAMRHLIKSFKRTSPANTSPLILALYDPDREFETLSKKCPKFLQSFESWVDLGELTREISPDQEKMPLVTTLDSFGYGLTQKVNAGYDAQWPPLTPKAEDSESLHIMAVLANMVWHPCGSKVGNIPLQDREALEKTIENPIAEEEKYDEIAVQVSVGKQSFDDLYNRKDRDRMLALSSIPCSTLSLWGTPPSEDPRILSWVAAVAESGPDAFEDQFAEYSIYTDDDVDFDIDLAKFSLGDE